MLINDPTYVSRTRTNKPPSFDAPSSTTYHYTFYSNSNFNDFESFVAYICQLTVIRNLLDHDNDDWICIINAESKIDGLLE